MIVGPLEGMHHKEQCIVAKGKLDQFESHVPIRIACDNRYAMGLSNLTSKSDNYRKEEHMS